MSIISEGLHHVRHIRVKNRMFHDFRCESIELGLIGQLTMNQQEGHFQEIGLFGENFNWDSSILQDSSVSIDVTY